MNTIVLMTILLFLAMTIIGGKKGFRSFIALFLNFSVMIILLFFMNIQSMNAIVLTLIACVVIACINLFFINEITTTTKAAFLSTLLTTSILLLVILAVSDLALIHGFGEEETEELGAFSPLIGISFMQLAISVIIMSTIGAITDAAIAIASPMREMYIHHPTSSRKELFQFGLLIGRDIIGTSTNTLFFAFIGNYLALMIWFKDLSYSIGDIVNSKIFSSEFITICCATIGVILVIPITAAIAAQFFVRKSSDRK